MIPECSGDTIKQWHAWLRKYHQTEKKVHLILYKRHTGKPAITHKEAMIEAIAWGWIDTTIKRIDDDRYQRAFAKRTEKSKWSNATQGYAKQLIKEGKMQPAGMQAYKWGLKHPVIDHGLPKNPAAPNDLKKALAKHKKAEQFFNNLAPSSKRFSVYWIEKAVKPETRAKRIKEIVQRCKEEKKPGEQ